MSDVTKPVITILGSNPVSVEKGTEYVDAGAIASDDKDGNITKRIVTSGDTFTNTDLGTHVITYDVSDLANNKAVQAVRLVNVIDTSTGFGSDRHLLGDNTRVFQCIDEIGTTNQNIIDLVIRANENASSELESLFHGNLDFERATSASLPTWFLALVTELQTAYFWVMSNNTEEAKTHREEVRAKAKMTLEKRFKPAFSTI